MKGLLISIELNYKVVPVVNQFKLHLLIVCNLTYQKMQFRSYGALERVVKYKENYYYFTIEY